MAEAFGQTVLTEDFEVLLQIKCQKRDRKSALNEEPSKPKPKRNEKKSGIHTFSSKMINTNNSPLESLKHIDSKVKSIKISIDSPSPKHGAAAELAAKNLQLNKERLASSKPELAPSRLQLYDPRVSVNAKQKCSSNKSTHRKNNFYSNSMEKNYNTQIHSQSNLKTDSICVGGRPLHSLLICKDKIMRTTTVAGPVLSPTHSRPLLTSVDEHKQVPHPHPYDSKICNIIRILQSSEALVPHEIELFKMQIQRKLWADWSEKCFMAILNFLFQGRGADDCWLRLSKSLNFHLNKEKSDYILKRLILFVDFPLFFQHASQALLETKFSIFGDRSLKPRHYSYFKLLNVLLDRNPCHVSYFASVYVFDERVSEFSRAVLSNIFAAETQMSITREILDFYTKILEMKPLDFFLRAHLSGLLDPGCEVKLFALPLTCFVRICVENQKFMDTFVLYCKFVARTLPFSHKPLLKRGFLRAAFIEILRLFAKKNTKNGSKRIIELLIKILRALSVDKQCEELASCFRQLHILDFFMYQLESIVEGDHVERRELHSVKNSLGQDNEF